MTEKRKWRFKCPECDEEWGETEGEYTEEELEKNNFDLILVIELDHRFNTKSEETFVELPCDECSEEGFEFTPDDFLLEKTKKREGGR